MTPQAAKKLVAETLTKHGLEFTKLTARTTSFSDLARASGVFVKIHGMTIPEPKLELVKHDLKHLGVILDPDFSNCNWSV